MHEYTDRETNQEFPTMLHMRPGRFCNRASQQLPFLQFPMLFFLLLLLFPGARSKAGDEGHVLETGRQHQTVLEKTWLQTTEAAVET